MPANLEDSAVATGLGTVSFHSNLKERQCKKKRMFNKFYLFESRSVVSDSLWPHGLYNPWNFPGQNTGVGSHSLLQGIFPTQGSNPGLPHCRRFFTSWTTREAQECSDYTQLHSSNTLVLKFLQARLQQYVNQELPAVQARFGKGRGTRNQIANIRWITEKQESSRKASTSALSTMPKPLTCGPQQTVE